MMIINSKQYSGSNITIKNNRIIIDGKDVTPEDEKVFNIQVDGSIQELSIDACNSFNMNGNAGSVKTMSGDVSCKEIKGSVSTMSGDIKYSKP